MATEDATILEFIADSTPVAYTSALYVVRMCQHALLFSVFLVFSAVPFLFATG
jgi:hypothetical protein